MAARFADWVSLLEPRALFLTHFFPGPTEFNQLATGRRLTLKPAIATMAAMNTAMDIEDELDCFRGVLVAIACGAPFWIALIAVVAVL